MAASRGSLTVGSAQIGAGSGTSRWEAGAPPIRYPDPNITVIDPRFHRYVLGNAAIEIVRMAGIIDAVRAAQHVGPKTHVTPPA